MHVWIRGTDSAAAVRTKLCTFLLQGQQSQTELGFCPSPMPNVPAGPHPERSFCNCYLRCQLVLLHLLPRVRLCESAFLSWCLPISVFLFSGSVSHQALDVYIRPCAIIALPVPEDVATAICRSAGADHRADCSAL